MIRVVSNRGVCCVFSGMLISEENINVGIKVFILMWLIGWKLGLS